MSNLNKANSLAHEWVESMGGLEAIRHGHDSDLSGLMQALEDAGLLMPDVQIIRTVEELEALDPDSCTLDKYGDFDFAKHWLDGNGKVFEGHVAFLPAIVFVTGVQFRAACKALEEENE